MLSLIIQAGGNSSRMGRDKGLLRLNGETLIERLVRRLGPLAEEILVTTNRPQDYQFLGLPLIGDLWPERGALPGLYTALKSASRPLTAVVACDMPFASPAIFARLRELAAQADAALPLPGGMEPLHAVYRPQTCLPAIETALRAGEKKVISWLPQVRLQTLSAAELTRLDPQGLAFFNLNTPSDLEEAQAIAAKTEHTQPGRK